MKRTPTLVTLLTLVLYPSFFLLAQGSLTPPGAPAPTMKTLDQIEPRTAIDATHTPGDDDSIYKITQPGSYYLTGNVAGVSGKMGIEIAVAAGGPGVSIDLMGFEVVGVAGSLEGINVTTAGTRNVAIHNGTVRGWGGNGVNTTASEGNVLANLRVQNNVDRGIRAGTNSVITNCTAQANAVGISTGSSSSVTHCTANSNTASGFLVFSSTLAQCTAFANGLVGIDAGSGGTVMDCTVGNNTNIGILAFDGQVVHCTARSNGSHGIQNEHGTILDCTANQNTGNGINGGLSTLVVRGCTAYLNSMDGIHATVGSIVTGCTTTSNSGDGIDAGAFDITVDGCITASNTGHGIRVGSQCRITNNQCYDNGKNAAIGSGIYVAGAGSRIDGNNVYGNDFGINVDGTANLITRNSASNNSSSNYSFNVAGNKYAQLISPGSAFVSTDPWANFAY
jgi:parallel beta-helix repeat protein